MTSPPAAYAWTPAPRIKELHAATTTSKVTLQDAINRCLEHSHEVWLKAFKSAKAEGESNALARRVAAVAYKLSMPPLDSLDNIKAHIACVAQGVNLEVYSGRDASQLLYAAQVALSLWKEKN